MYAYVYTCIYKYVYTYVHTSIYIHPFVYLHPFVYNTHAHPSHPPIHPYLRSPLLVRGRAAAATSPED